MRPNSVIGCPNSVTPYNQINQVGLHNYFYIYIDIYLHTCDVGIYGKMKVAILKNIHQIRMLMGDKWVSKTRILAVFRVV